jgi:hypothetical protein
LTPFLVVIQSRVITVSEEGGQGVFSKLWPISLRVSAVGSEGGLTPVRKVEAIQEDSEEYVIYALVGLGRSLENS